MNIKEMLFEVEQLNIVTEQETQSTEKTKKFEARKRIETYMEEKLLRQNIGDHDYLF